MIIQYGDAPLICAAEEGDVEIATLLINNGCDIFIQNKVWVHLISHMK